MVKWTYESLETVVFIDCAAANTIPDGDNMVWVGPNINQAIMENVHVKRSGSSLHFKFYAAVNARHGRIGDLYLSHPPTDIILVNSTR